MGFCQLLHRHSAFADHDITGIDRVIGDLALVQGREESAFAEHKAGAIGMGLGEEVGGIHGRGVEMLCRYADYSQVLQTNGQVFGRRRRIIREKEKRRATR